MERSAALGDRKAVFLERILLCATSVLASAFATLSIARLTRVRQSKRRRQEHGQPKLSHSDFEKRERQLLATAARVKELEAAVSLLEADKEEAGTGSLEAAAKLAEAAKEEKEMRHELGKAKFAAKEMQDAHRAAFKEKEAALAKVRDLQGSNAELEKSIAEARTAASGLQRSLTALRSEKQAAERRASQLELDLSASLAAKARAESKCQQTVRAMEEKLQSALESQRSAQEGLGQYQSRMAQMRDRVDAFNRSKAAELEKLRHLEQAVELSQRQAALEVRRRSVLEPQLASCQKRVRELEAELKITRESVRSSLKRTSSRNSVESHPSTSGGA